MSTQHDNTQADTQWLLNAYDPLHEARIKGTPRPGKETTITPEQRNQLDIQARIEKQEHGAFVLGESPAPLHIDILDRLLHIQKTTHHLATQIATALQDTTTNTYLTNVKNTDPIHLLQYINTSIPKLTEPRHQQALDDTEKHLRDLKHQTAAYFSEIIEGKQLKAECPWCGGTKLRFRLIGQTHPEFVIRCETGLCEPPPQDCGAWTGKGFTLPTWPQWEWQWLATRLNNTITKGTRR
jgi:hypothetical protein